MDARCGPTEVAPTCRPADTIVDEFDDTPDNEGEGRETGAQLATSPRRHSATAPHKEKRFTIPCETQDTATAKRRPGTDPIGQRSRLPCGLSPFVATIVPNAKQIPTQNDGELPEGGVRLEFALHPFQPKMPHTCTRIRGAMRPIYAMRKIHTCSNTIGTTHGVTYIETPTSKSSVQRV